MTDTKHPEALRLIEQYDYGGPVTHSNKWNAAACNELRRTSMKTDAARSGPNWCSALSSASGVRLCARFSVTKASSAALNGYAHHPKTRLSPSPRPRQKPERSNPMNDAASAAPTYQQVIAAWNAQADEHNQWSELGEDEKVEWAVACAKTTPPAVAPTDAMVDSYLRAQRETVEAVDRKFGHPNGKAPSHLHPVREACRAGLAAALAVAPPAVVEPLLEQHHRDSKELRKLCAERDQARRERDVHKAEIAGLEASCSTLGKLVDELRADAERLEWVLRRCAGSWLRAYLGLVSDTSDMDTLRTLIDANRGALTAHGIGIKKEENNG